MRQSEFGRGLATCLFEFAMHRRRLAYYRVRLVGYGDEVGLWANGASDHLCDLVTGGRVPADVRRRAKALQASGLQMGHGFTGRVYTVEEAEMLLSEADSLLDMLGSPRTLDEAMDIDRGLGLRPDRGAWACSEDLEK
jgi:hypothetical protein